MRVGDLVIIGIGGMLFLALSIVLFVLMYQKRMIMYQLKLKELDKQKQLELTTAVIRGEEEERMRISSELHDDINSTLLTMKLFLYQAVRHPENTSFVIQSQEALDESIEKIRNLSHRLQPSMVHQSGLHAALHSHVDSIKRSASIEVSYIVHSPVKVLNETAELAVYRIVQELITNILKHSGASFIKISSVVEASLFTIEVMHDGQGITDEMFERLVHKPGSIGLKNITNRLKVISGAIKFSKSENHHFLANITVPLT